MKKKVVGHIEIDGCDKCPFAMEKDSPHGKRMECQNGRHDVPLQHAWADELQKFCTLPSFAESKMDAYELFCEVFGQRDVDKWMAFMIQYLWDSDKHETLGSLRAALVKIIKDKDVREGFVAYLDKTP